MTTIEPTTRSVTVRMGLLNKRPDWTLDEFRRYWRDHHGALAAQVPGLRRYHQNHVVDSAQRGIAFARGPEQLDGISELWFDGVDAMRTAMATPQGRALVPDEQHFLGRLRLVTAEQTEVIALPKDATLLKRMSLLRRAPRVSEAEFRREWQVKHAELVKRTPGVRGYRQNLVVGRQVVKGTDCGYEALPIDGIVELWFDDPASLEAAYRTPQGERLMAHAAEFIGEITTFLVEPHTVV